MVTNEPDRCPSEEILAAFVERTLSAPEQAAFEDHLGSCAECRFAASALADALDPAVEAPPGYDPQPLEAFMESVIASRASKSARGPRPMLRWLPLVAASMVVAIGATFALRATPPLAATVVSAPVLAPTIEETTVPPLPTYLGGADRYLAHVSTDKPIYRPGERIFARAVVLNAFDRKPIEDRAAGGTAQFVVKSALGAVLTRAISSIENGVAAFQWTLPESEAGGRFTLIVASARFPETEASFDVRDQRAPGLSTDLQFARRAYGPGESVEASLAVTRASGGIPSGASVAVVAAVDGREVVRATTTLDGLGRATATFVLPARMSAGSGTLSMTVTDGGTVETAAKSIPIVLDRVTLSVSPEGGDLVAGVPCRVYVEARTPSRRPADVAGRVIDSSGTVVAHFETVHEGRGRFTFTPRPGEWYSAVLDRPTGISGEYRMPVVRLEGVNLTALADGFDADESVRVAVTSPYARVVTVGLYQRERELALTPIRLAEGVPTVVTIRSREAATGVLRVTAFGAKGVPLAERLVFRRPSEGLKIELRPDASDMGPGGRSRVEVLATDGAGRPVAAVVGLCVTDDSLLSLVDPRERAPRLPVSALLGAEVSELNDATAYLGGDADSARNGDLLLGTQGWRRFAHVNVGTFVDSHGKKAWRTLAAVGTRYAIQSFRGTEIFLSPSNYTPPDVIDLIPSDEVNDEENPLFGGESEEVTYRYGGPGLPSGVVWNPSAGAYFNDGRDGDFRGRTENIFERPLGSILRELARTRSVHRNVGVDVRDVGVDFRGLGGPTPGSLVNLDDVTNGLEDASGWRRVYAHRTPAERATGPRSDFTDTVYWHAGLVTDARGRATIEFHASDAITTLRVRADAFTKAGALASSDATITVRRPFHLEAKLPIEVTAGDRIDLPVSLSNGTRGSIDAALEVSVGEGLVVGGGAGRTAAVAALGSSRVIVPIAVGLVAADVPVRVAGGFAAAADDVTRTVRVVAGGFPVEKNVGGVLEGAREHEIVVAADTVEGSVSTSVTVYPSPMSTLSAALEGLLREPAGCFEQTSSTNYPNVMALQYLKSHAGADPALVSRARGMLARGYARLLSFESKSGGYEWFGADPGHEALTAYGLMEFADMAQVMNVDRDMIERTRRWLRSRRDGKGGFLENTSSGCHFGRDARDVTDAYVLWALLETGDSDLGPEIAHVRKLASASSDPYLLALVANVLWRADDGPAARLVLDRLRELQAKDGSVPGAATSITQSGGESLVVETTSLAVLAWLRSAEHQAPIESAMRWLASRCEAGRFGSTQATILSLKAILAYDAARAATSCAAGAVVAEVDGEVVGRIAFPAEHKASIAVPDFGSNLSSGRHVVRLRMEGGRPMPYSMTVRSHVKTRVSSPTASVSLDMSLAKADAIEGDPLDVTVTVTNREAQSIPMVTAIIGLPGGLEARTEALTDLVKSGVVDAYELRGREVVLYWRGLVAGASKSFAIPCVAAIPGSYTGPASRAYLYYTDEQKVWVAGVSLLIRPR